VERLEGRSLLVVITFAGGIATGTGTAAGQTSTQSLPFSSAPTTGTVEGTGYSGNVVSVKETNVAEMIEADADLVYDPSAPWAGDPTTTVAAEFTIEAYTEVAFPPSGTGTVTAFSQAGSGASVQGDFITVTLNPGPGDQPGAPVSVTLNANGYTGLQPGATAGYDFSYDVGHGPITLLGAAPAGVSSSIDSQQFKEFAFQSTIGATFRVSASVFAQASATAPTLGCGGYAIADLDVLVSKNSGMVSSKKPIADTVLRNELQTVADALGWDIMVVGSETNVVPPGVRKKNLQLQKQGAAFHVTGLTDDQVFAALKSWDGLGQGYEVIEYGPLAKGRSSRIHIGRFNANVPSQFFTEGFPKNGHVRAV
jgi:hypothetical protein